MPIKLPKLHSILEWHRNRAETQFKFSAQRWSAFIYRRINNSLNRFRKDFTNEILDWGQLADDGKAYFKPVIFNTYLNGSKAAYGALGLDQRSFDIVNVEAVQIADKITADLVTNITNETRDAIRLRVKEGIKSGKSYSTVANELRSFIGLNTKQSNRLFSYKIDILTKNPTISTSDLNRRLSAFSSRLHRERLETIARTETARAQNHGYITTLSNEGIKRFEFSTYPDCCVQFCIGLSGNVYGSKEALGIIPVHPRCKCALLPVV